MLRHRRPLISFLLAALGCSIPFAAVLWVCCTHDLHLNVYTDENVVLYPEYFPTYFNVIVTAVLSLILGLIVATIIWLTRFALARRNQKQF